MQMAPTLIPSLLAIAEDTAHYSVAICQQAFSIIRNLLIMLGDMAGSHPDIPALLQKQLPACMHQAGSIIAAPITLSVSTKACTIACKSMAAVFADTVFITSLCHLISGLLVKNLWALHCLFSGLPTSLPSFLVFILPLRPQQRQADPCAC